MTQSPVTLRNATPDDAQAIADLHVRSWQWAYRGLIPDTYLDGLTARREQRIEQRRTNLMELAQRPYQRWWLAEQAGQVVGFAITGRSHDADVPTGTAEVHAIYLAPEAVGQGVGRALFTQVVADLRQRGFTYVTLWVLEKNQRARAFYEAAGWAPDGARKAEEWAGTFLQVIRYAMRLTQ